jgi:predicted transcriptional regulator
MGLNAIQRRVLVVMFKEQREITAREIGTQIDESTKTTAANLRILLDEGYVTMNYEREHRKENTVATYALSTQGAEFVEEPVG